MSSILPPRYMKPTCWAAIPNGDMISGSAARSCARAARCWAAFLGVSPPCLVFVATLAISSVNTLSKRPSEPAMMMSSSTTGTLNFAAASGGSLIPSPLPSWYGKLKSCCCCGDLNTILPFLTTMNPESPRLAAWMVSCPKVMMQAVHDPWTAVCLWAVLRIRRGVSGVMTSSASAAARHFFISNREYSPASIPTSAQPPTPSATPMATPWLLMK
mmetsp:Transcript_20437/g.56641  ORF Transcript_20437/g.56641 Transcript_20437/m.56641 type:complete len:215 (+) Transcript_20437:194-838(+)